MTFLLWSITIGLTFAGVYYLVARWFLNRVQQAHERTQAERPPHVNRLPVLPLPTRPTTPEERIDLSRKRVAATIRDRALEPYERNGRGA